MNSEQTESAVELLLADWCEASGTYFTETYRPSAKTRQMVSNPVQRDNLLQLIRAASALAQPAAPAEPVRCQPTSTECQRCENDISKCDGTFAPPPSPPLPPPQGVNTCVVSGLPVTDVDACGDCDPCLFGQPSPAPVQPEAADVGAITSALWQRIGDVIEDSLANYRCTHWVLGEDGEDGGMPLTDLFTPAEQDSVAIGHYEMELLCDHLLIDLHNAARGTEAARAPASPSGSAGSAPSPSVSALRAPILSAWAPIETAPKDGTYILVTREHLAGSWVAHWSPVAVSGYRFEQPWRSVMLNHYHIDKESRYLPPTHWQPLPTWLCIARGMEARSGETEGLDPEGATARPEGARPEDPAGGDVEKLREALTGASLRRLFCELEPLSDCETEEEVSSWWKHYAAKVRLAAIRSTQRKEGA